MSGRKCYCCFTCFQPYYSKSGASFTFQEVAQIRHWSLSELLSQHSRNPYFLGQILAIFICVQTHIWSLIILSTINHQARPVIVTLSKMLNAMFLNYSFFLNCICHEHPTTAFYNVIGIQLITTVQCPDKLSLGGIVLREMISVLVNGCRNGI